MTINILQDMKKYNYYYWFAYPCLSEPLIEEVGECKPIAEHFSAQQVDQLNKLYFQVKECDQLSFFILERNLQGSLAYFKLADKISATNKEANFANDAVEQLYFCFSDPCATANIAGWTLRLYISMLIHLW